MKLSIILVATALLLPLGGSWAQTANSSPTAPSPGGGAAAATGPAGGTADRSEGGSSKIGPETQTEKREQEKSQKATTICKGC